MLQDSHKVHMILFFDCKIEGKHNLYMLKYQNMGIEMDIQ